MTRIDEIKERLSKATEGEWAYDKKRDTHDSCIYVKGSVEEYGYISQNSGGIVGSSEWIWIENCDGEFIANSKQDIAFLLKEISRLQELVPVPACRREL